jgi:hypothetical protein
MLSKYFIYLFDLFIFWRFYRQIIHLLKKVDVLHMKKSFSGENMNDDQYFLHTYDDYFS